jgi:hypothetical protein
MRKLTKDLNRDSNCIRGTELQSVTAELTWSFHVTRAKYVPQSMFLFDFGIIYCSIIVENHTDNTKFIKIGL